MNDILLLMTEGGILILSTGATLYNLAYKRMVRVTAEKTGIQLNKNLALLLDLNLVFSIILTTLMISLMVASFLFSYSNFRIFLPISGLSN